MKKKTKICLGILLVILMMMAWFVYKNMNTIEALVDAFRYSNEDVEENLQENKDELQKVLDESEDVTVREMTPEEVQALIDGTMTEEELVAKMTGQEVSEQESPKATETTTKNNEKGNEKDNENEKPSEPTATATPKPEKTSEQIISELVAKMYIQESTYLNKLDDIEAEATAEFIAEVKANKIPPSEEGALKKRMMPKYLPKVASWEKECDTYIYGLIDEIRAELKKSGKDETLADELKSGYLQKKKAKKAYFINRYMD